MPGTIRNDGTSNSSVPPQQEEDWANEGYSDYSFEREPSTTSTRSSSEVSSTRNTSTTRTATTSASTSYTSTNTAMNKALASNASLPEPPDNPANSYVQQLSQQGMSSTQIRQQVQARYGIVMTD